ncbi:unnamed protein product [Cercospora beticola]|nr:unnamed protein product [Cercospora beticola]
MIGSTLEHPVNAGFPYTGGTACVVPIDGTSHSCMNTIRSWIQRCDNTHSFCRIDKSASTEENVESSYPRLLIRLGNTAEDLCIQQSDPGHKRYGALSYCWGRSESLKLVRENYVRLSKCLPWSDLAKTHQDAIHVSRELGLEYLWIDALCIIQDEPEQQAAEITNMATIYANAYVTIAASSSAGGESGFLRAREPTLTVAVTLKDGNRFDVFAREVVSHATFDYGWDAMTPEIAQGYQEWLNAETTTRFPLFGRGWAWQERLLSPRILHFTDTEVIWECLDSISCECGTLETFVGNRVLAQRRYVLDVPRDIDMQPEQLARGRALAERYDMLKLPTVDPESSFPGFFNNGLKAMHMNDYSFMFACMGRPPDEYFEQRDSDHYDRWRDVISQFSRRKLTFEQDVFAAVSGLASMWHDKRQSEGRYLAGLWEADLLRGLLWVCADNSEGMEVLRPTRYLAPSWSWASVRRPVDWLPSVRERKAYHASILDVVCVTTTGDTFGKVSNGSFIDVAGHALKATITSCRDKSATAFVFIDDQNHAFATDCHPEVRALIGEEVLCLLWATDNVDVRTGQGLDRCLVLKACDTTSNTFTRIGITSSLPRGSHLFTSTEKVNIRIV